MTFKFWAVCKFSLTHDFQIIHKGEFVSLSHDLKYADEEAHGNPLAVIRINHMIINGRTAKSFF
jgi:hypothetical protein